MNYGQFCPISKAAEILGEKWTILIVRELLAGGRRFSELQRGLGYISPALLTSRLKSLEQQNMVVRRRSPGLKGYEYYPTEAANALEPALMALGEWGLCWARNSVLNEDFDVDFLMLYLERSINPAKLVGDKSTIRFHFTDIEEMRNWWVLVDYGNVDVCLKDPGRDVDVYLTSSVRTMADVWMGDRTYIDAIKSGDLRIEGDPALTRNITTWLTPAAFADSVRPSPAG